MKYISILACLVITSSYIQAKKQTDSQMHYAPIDFTQSIWNVSANSKGRIKSETWYKNPRNDAGNAYVYMVHKNGGNWWYQEAKKKFPNFYANYLIVERRIKDHSLLKDYNKWAFFVDKKDLKAVLGSSGSRGDTIVYYYPKYPHTVILYEQKASSKQWVEIDRKTFASEEEESKSTWESDFVNQKVRESNLNAPVEK